MTRRRKFLVAFVALVILFAIFGRPPAVWKQVRVGMTWKEANSVVNQKGVFSVSRDVASADGQRHTERTFWCYKEFIVVPLWALRIDLRDDRVVSIRIGLLMGDIEHD
ncbi:MAG: hypothetical protein U1F83_05525 [Verrucomicrobiota bacterium]